MKQSHPIPGRILRTLSAGTIALAVTLNSLAPAEATPYATSLTNDAGVISFRLNEAADDVKVIWNSGATTNNLGSRTAGLTTTNLGVSGDFFVEVFKQGDSVIKTNTTPVSFDLARGVAVNRNPASPYFGRVYAVNGVAGVRGDGVFAFNSDLTDAVGQGTNALDGGFDFTLDTTSPFRVTVGEDDNQVYVTDWSDTNGNLYVTDPDLANWGYALQPLSAPGAAVWPVTTANNHGSVTAAAVTGSTNTGDLVIYTIDEDLTTDRDVQLSERNSLWQYPIGSGPLPSSVYDPTNLIATGILGGFSQTKDLAHASNGYFYMGHYRSVGTEAGVFVIDPALGVITNSLDISTSLESDTDILKATSAVSVSRDSKYLAHLNIENGIVSVVPLVNGIPDLSAIVQFTGFPASNGRGIAFDAAYNIYVTHNNGGNNQLQSLSLGITSTTTTGSDGTFSIDAPLVSIVATDPTASETAPDTGSLTITRDGSTSAPLVLDLSITGLASNGVDYAEIPTTVTLGVGQSSTNILILPVDDDISEANERVIVSFSPGTNYSAISQSSATVTIIDNDPPLVTISALITNMYESIPDDYVVYELTRGGDVDNTSLTVQIGYSGTASNFTDFNDNGSTFVSFQVGQGIVTFTNNPIDDAEIEGTETIVATILPDAFSSYVTGALSNAVTYIVDNDLQPGAVVFSDDFDTDTSANWTKTWGSANGVEDDIVNFNFDYSLRGIPAAPGGFTTTGLRVSANKQDATLSQAGVNLYPNGVSISNSFALRFQMFIEGVDGAGTTEHVLFGINQSGTGTNWAIRSTGGNGFNAATPAGGDGIWFNIVEDASGFPGASDYGAFTSVSAPPTILDSASATSFETVLKAPPFRFAGSPASFSATLRQAWVDVEVRQINGIVTMSVNNTEVLQFPNTTGVDSGNIMLGYNDAFGSIGGGDGNTITNAGDIFSGFVIFDNVRVIDLTLRITNIRVIQGGVQIDFIGTLSDTPASFELRSSATVNGTYTTVNSAGFTQLSPGHFRVTAPLNGEARYYQIVKP